MDKSGQWRGHKKMVTVDDPRLCRFLSDVKQHCSEASLVWEGGNAASMNFLSAASHVLKLQPGFYNPYSFRRGGDTYHYVVFSNLQATILRGRWSDLKTARIYIQDGSARCNDLKRSAVANAAIAHWEARFNGFIQQF